MGRKKVRNDWRTIRKRIALKYIIEICFYKRKREEIMKILIEDYQSDITDRQITGYLSELRKKKILLTEPNLGDLRTVYYFTNGKKVG